MGDITWCSRNLSDNHLSSFKYPRLDAKQAKSRMKGIGCAASKINKAFKSWTISRTRLSRCCCSVSFDRLYQSANDVNKLVRNAVVWC